MFSQRCPQCREIFHGTFCEEGTCHRKFVLVAGYDRTHCPLHDPALKDAESIRADRLRETLACPCCGSTLFGVQPEDQKERTSSPRG